MRSAISGNQAAGTITEPELTAPVPSFIMATLAECELPTSSMCGITTRSAAGPFRCNGNPFAVAGTRRRSTVVVIGGLLERWHSLMAGSPDRLVELDDCPGHQAGLLGSEEGDGCRQLRRV